jgi:hypothetical protein
MYSVCCILIKEWEFIYPIVIFGETFCLRRGYLWLVSLTFHSHCKGGCKHSIVDRSNLMWWQQFALGLHALPQLPVGGGGVRESCQTVRFVKTQRVKAFRSRS